MAWEAGALFWGLRLRQGVAEVVGMIWWEVELGT